MSISFDSLPISDVSKRNMQDMIREFGREVEDEIIMLINQKKFDEIEDRFYKKLEFGTGGMRGKVGIGTNRINKYTIHTATQGFANYLKKVKGSKNLSCVIGYDTRKDSRSLAIEAARVLVGNGIRTYLIKIPMPTPFISFAIRYLKASGGVILTASHNPPNYNGYKVYWDDGAQVVAPHDKGIIQEFYNITSSRQINLVSEDELKSSQLFSEVLEEVKEAYLDTLKSNLKNLYDIEKPRYDGIKIAYTPLHGTSLYLTPDALRYIGFRNIYLVEKETTVDGNFSAVPSPNPEDDNSFNGVVELAKEVGAQVFFASDPDADRVRVGINDSGNITLFSGNQIASMMLSWILTNLSKRNLLPEDSFVVTTIVTTGLISKISRKFGVETYLTLTGFKYIGEKIRIFEGRKKFIFGCEESIGYLYGDDVRDKDSVISTCILSLMVEDLMSQSKNLNDYLMDIYREYGVHIESLMSLDFEGVEGQKRIELIMEKVRNSRIDTIGELSVMSRIDLKNRTYEDFGKSEKEEYKTDLPISDVVIINLEGGSKVVVRPSGTEPKIKIYFFSEFDNKVENLRDYEKKHKLMTEDFKRKFIEK
ncbi:MAG: phospho-sugar mutase [Brevinematales bacterium]|nr:phospho-sugar mutase [Brevinematales bacterium]